MDLQTRKLEFIGEFLKIQSEELISRLERILKNNEKFTSFTMEELNAKINESMEDSKNDHVMESNELLSEIKEWE